MLRLAEFILNNYSGKVVEVGIGNYSKVAEFLAERGLKVITTDIVTREPSVEFHIDDVTNPDPDIYQGPELVYSIRPPPEIFDAIISLSKRISADCIIKPLYGDYPGGRLVNYRGLAFYLWRWRK